MKGSRPVIKHRFTKGPNGVARMRAHVNYIQYREGDDRADRTFFDPERDAIDVREVRDLIGQSDWRGVIAHRFIVSPGVRGVDIRAFTRETMEEIARSRGYDLEWRAIVHANTDHDHAHVVVMGKDKNGKYVKFGVKDYTKMREVGDRILDRDYQLERYLDRDLRNSLERDYKPDRGDAAFNRLFFGEDDTERERRNRRDDIEDRRLHDEMSKRPGQKDGVIHRSVRGRQRIIEQQGRLSDFHEGYVNAMAQQDGRLPKEIPDRENADAQISKSMPSEKERDEKFGPKSVSADSAGKGEQDALHRLFGIAQPKEREARTQHDRADETRTNQVRSTASDQLAQGGLQQSVNQTQPKRRRGDEEDGGET